MFLVSSQGLTLNTGVIENKLQAQGMEMIDFVLFNDIQ